MVRIASLGDRDLNAPFRLHIGDEVARRRTDGTLDADMHGVVVGGTVEYHEDGSLCRDSYEVRRRDGSTFQARSFDLIKREPLFVNIREAARIIREWVGQR